MKIPQAEKAVVYFQWTHELLLPLGASSLCNENTEPWSPREPKFTLLTLQRVHMPDKELACVPGVS